MVRLERGERELSITLRSIRDEHFEGQRMTLARRLALHDAFTAAGLETSERLIDVDLDQLVTIKKAPAGWLQKAGSWLRHPIVRGGRGATSMVVGAVSLFAAAIAIVAYFENHEPRRMSGDLNVVAAAFESRPSFDGEALADSVARSLRTSLSRDRSPAAPDLQVMGPTDIDTPRSEAMARQVAEQVNADIVVYGTIEQRPAGTVVLPRLYVDAARLRVAEELGGDYARHPIAAGHLPVDNAVAARSRLRVAVAEHMRGLSAFAVGLGWFNAASWRRASEWFEAAQSAWPTGRHAAMVSLFQGNAAGKEHRLVAARSAYRRALRVAPGMDRARLGLIEVSLHQAQGDCDETASSGRLRAVARRYGALASIGDPGTLTGRALRIRSRLGEARANFCLSQAELGGRWPQAVEAFHAVLRYGAHDQDRFRMELAEARAGLGFAALPTSASAKGARQAYLRARRQYSLARELTTDSARRRGFEQMIGFIDRRLGAIAE